jgi:hypothetical protein
MFMALMMIFGIYVIGFMIFPRIDQLEREVVSLWEIAYGDKEDQEEQEAEIPWQPEVIDNQYRYKVIGFVGRALSPNGPGLAIGRWKSEEGWAQRDVENMLDYLARIGVITERQNGKACQWTIPEPTIGKVIRQFDSKPSYPSYSLPDLTEPYDLTA